MVWFEQQGHSPWVSESDCLIQAQIETALGQTSVPWDYNRRCHAEERSDEDVLNLVKS